MDMLPLPPVAGPFVQSLRSIGYSLESAVADIIDNSISARAGTIDVFTEWRNGTPVLAIMDDGYGMSPNQIRIAMQLGAVGPTENRTSDDLGRFGMGLKTASFSQCKKLTLISRTDENENWYGLRWDLDLVERENNWLVEIIDSTLCQSILNDVDCQLSKGTAVIWNNFDRIIDSTAANSGRDYDRRITILIDHLALTFHRFIMGDEVPHKICLHLNNRRIDAKDPFAKKPEPDRQASTLLSEEKIRLGSHSVKIRAHLLPHPSNLSHTFANRVSPRADHHSGQGIYIYRGGRLIVSGGWLKLAKISEANKLARIQVDFGNDADSLWQIDVRKSRIDLPASLREQLRRIIRECSTKSSTTFTRRARMPSLDIEPIWQRVFNRDTSRVRYTLNKNHSLVSAILLQMPEIERAHVLLRLIESSLPIELIKNDLSATGVKLLQEPGDIIKKCRELAEHLFNIGFDNETIQRALVDDSNIGLTEEQAHQIVRHLGR